MIPNLFDFATSELSNDAIICWLVSWINYNDSEFKNLSEDLIMLFTNTVDLESKSINVRRQYEKIDILLEVNDNRVIVIEDKTNTKEHSNQCETYKSTIDNDIKYKNYQKHYVYLKIGNESFDDRIESIGYLWVSRSELLATLKRHKHINSDLLHNYIDYLQKLEDDFLSYKEVEDINNWSSYAWQGFYTELQSKMNLNKWCWHRVFNSGGSFLGFNWNSTYLKYNDELYEIYLQIEANHSVASTRPNISFKLSCSGDEKIKKIIRYYLSEQLKDLDLYHIKETYRRISDVMTIAKISGFNNSLELKESIKLAEVTFKKLVDNLKDGSISYIENV
jgi:hypothetical protein